MRKLLEPEVPSDLYGEALLEFLVDAANHYAEAQWWRMPTIAAHFEQYAIDANDAEVIETCEFLAWRCELARSWIEAERAKGRPDHELTWQHASTRRVVLANGRYRIELPEDWWESAVDAEAALTAKQRGIYAVTRRYALINAYPCATRYRGDPR